MKLTLLSLACATALGTTAVASLEESTCSAATVAAAGKMDIVDTAVAAGSFNTLAAALKAGGLVDALKGDGPFTVFAPTDDAFAKLPKGAIADLLKPENKGTLQSILTFHVVPGRVMAKDVVKISNATSLNGQRLGVRLGQEGEVFVQNAKVVRTDIECTNGVIHVIDAVIMPNTMDIVDTAVKNGSFKTLAAALGAAGLVEALKSEGPFTVFAPTDEAFAKLPAGTVETLLKPENKERLAAVLKYHVVSGRVYSDAAAKGATVATLQGGKITTRSHEGRVFVNDAQVVAADIDTTNGVIHVIDSVILP